MPQPKWYHKSLSELCMDSIVDNMEKWTASRSLVHVSTPFYLLPSHCLEYIIQCLDEDGRLKEEMFDLLLNPHSKVLDLSRNACKGVKRHLRIVSLASVRCSQLTTLKFCSNELPSPTQVEETFTPMLQLFEHLQILDLSNSIYGAICMLNLGSTCKPKIRELLVDFCPRVTDLVMQVFCKGQSSLHKLSVLGTKVTHAGIRFAIEHLPELKELGSTTDIPQVLFRIRESKKYSLTKLSMGTIEPNLTPYVPYKKGNVSLMVDMCPSLVDLFIDVKGGEGFTNEELLGFRELKLIKNLVIWTSFMPSISIHGGVIPLLQVHGPTLEELSLSMEVTSEEVYLIIECCPNIRRLRLAIESAYLETPEPMLDCVHSSFRYSKEVIPLRMLEEIILFSADSSSPFAISRKLLLLLLFSPSLTLISICNCITLDDQIIEEACTRNSFKYLTKLKLTLCSNVSQKGIDFFMNETNPLAKITLVDCGNVNLENMKTMAQEKHWNLR